MKTRSTILLILGCSLLAFGYMRDHTGNLISKIHLHDNLLIRTTPGVDIAFYDVSNPADVQELGRLTMDGNSDVATIGTIMYADQDRDLVVYDIANPASPVALDTVRGVFNRSGREIANWMNGAALEGDEFGGTDGCAQDGCIEDLNSVDEESEPNWGWGSTMDPRFVSYSNGSVGSRGGVPTGTRSAASNVSADASGSSREGTGGSLTRFMVVGNRLYCIDERNLVTFDITDRSHPSQLSTLDVDWTIETIFYSDYHLFIGGERGVYIYDIEDGKDPEYRGEFEHVESCDPVVVEDDRAYVTLRGGGPCGGMLNQMDILDVSNVTDPQLIESYEDVNSPFGLGVRNGTVILADGPSGLRILNASDPGNVVQCGLLDDITPFDVIWQNNVLIVTAEEGFFIYDVSDPCNPQPFGRLF